MIKKDKEHIVSDEHTEIKELLDSFLAINHAFVELDKQIKKLDRGFVYRPSTKYIRSSRKILMDSFDTFIKAQYEIYLLNLELEGKLL